MNEWLKDFVQQWIWLSKTERIGFIWLTILLVLLLITRFTLSLWVRPDLDRQAEQALVQAWEDRQKAMIEESRTKDSLFYFDPNQLDSIGWRHLGLKEHTIRLLLNWRKSGKKFYRKEDLKAVYTLADSTYQRLEPYIQITVLSNPDNKRGSTKRATTIIELNTADSVQLVSLWGIGPRLAKSIISRRSALGGFVEIEQLLEIYLFKDTVIKYLQQNVWVDTGRVTKININKADKEQLAAHPYIGSALAASIIEQRNQMGYFRNIEDLTVVSLMNEENYRKIAPYLTVY